MMKPSAALPSNQRCRPSATASGVPLNTGRGEAASSATAQREVALAGAALDGVGGAAKAVLPQIADVGEGRVQRMAGEVVMLEVAAEVVEGVLDADRAGGFTVLALDVRVVVADDHADATEDAQIVRFAPLFHQLSLHVLIEILCLFQRVVMGEDRIGVLGRQPFAVFGGAGTEQDRAPCGVRPMFSGPCTEKNSPVIESVQFAGAEEFAAGLITHEGVVFPESHSPLATSRNSPAMR